MTKGTDRELSNGHAAPGLATLVLHCRDGAKLVRIAPGTSITLGRQPPSDVVIPDASLSRRHARFGWDGKVCTVTDLQSTNGTHVRGKVVARARLRQGEAVVMGAVSARVFVPVAQRASGELDQGPLRPQSAVMAPVYARADALAVLPGHVFVMGEAGVGKATVARAMHARSPRARGPFAMLKCSAVPAHSLGAALFGGEREGLLARCQGGTLYLADAQLLARDLQERIAECLRPPARARVGGRASGHCDVRLVVGAQRELGDLSASGSLHPALARLVGSHQLWLPALSERRSDIVAWAEVFLREALTNWPRPPLSLGDQVCQLLEQCPWPENLRQLREVVEHATLVCRGSTIEPADLPASLSLLETARFRPTTPGLVDEALGAALGPSPLQAESGGDFRARVRAFEARLILEGLRHTNGNQRAASRLLRIPLRTLVHKIKDYGLKDRI